VTVFLAFANSGSSSISVLAVTLKKTLPRHYEEDCSELRMAQTMSARQLNDK